MAGLVAFAGAAVEEAFDVDFGQFFFAYVVFFGDQVDDVHGYFEG